MHPFGSSLVFACAWASQQALPLFEPSSFLAPGPREIQVKPEVSDWKGRHVRLIGFMTKFEHENPILGGFLLSPMPVMCDESGGGLGDLPPSAVLVVIQSQKDKPADFIPGRLSVSGILKVGPVQTACGTVLFQLVLDPAPTMVKS